MQTLDYPSLDYVVLPPEGNDLMPEPTNKQRLGALEQRLIQIEAALGLRAPSPKKSFLREKYELAINHKGTSLILAIILCFVGLYGKYWLDHRIEWWNNDVDTRINKILDDKGGIKETLNSVQGSVTRTESTLKALQPFIDDVVNHQFESASKLPTAILQERLPAIQHLLATAKDQGVKANPRALASLNRSLGAMDTNANGFWPTTGEFISYRSVLISGSTGWENLKPCGFSLTDANHMHASWNDKNGHPAGEAIVTAISVSNCYIDLDGKTIAHWTCTHCAVHYSGGQVFLDDIRLEDCLFIFSLPANPAPPSNGQQLSKLLLASNLKAIDIKSL